MTNVKGIVLAARASTSRRHDIDHPGPEHPTSLSNAIRAVVVITSARQAESANGVARSLVDLGMAAVAGTPQADDRHGAGRLHRLRPDAGLDCVPHRRRPTTAFSPDPLVKMAIPGGRGTSPIPFVMVPPPPRGRRDDFFPCSRGTGGRPAGPCSWHCPNRVVPRATHARSRLGPSPCRIALCPRARPGPVQRRLINAAENLVLQNRHGLLFGSCFTTLPTSAQRGRSGRSLSAQTITSMK